MHPRNLRTFVAAATTLNFSRAAEVVHLAPSSVTEQIQALESDVGASLFDRSRRTLSLTPAGSCLLNYARELLALHDEARAAVVDAAGEGCGTITVGSLETLAAHWLPTILTDLQTNQPFVGVTLKVTGTRQLRNAVQSGDLDVCFTFDAVATGPDMLRANVGQTNIVAIVPPDHRFAELGSVSLDRFVGERFIVTETDCAYRQMFDHVFPDCEAGQPQIVAEVGSIAAILNMVGAGMGCAIVPQVALPNGGTRVAVLSIDGGTLVAPITMSWRRRRVQSPTLRAFLANAQHRQSASNQAMSAIDMQHSSRDEPVVHQETDRIGNVLGLTDATNRQAFSHSV